MKRTAIGISLASLPALLAFLYAEPNALASPLAFPLILLLPLAATFTMLAAYLHKTAPADLVAVIILLGLGLGFMLLPGVSGRLSLGAVFIALIVLLLRKKRPSRFSAKWAIALYGFALAALLASFALPSRSASILLLLVYGILLPICPLHGASIVSFSRLDGILPNFIAVFLPALGLRGVLGILHDLPPVIINVVSIFALIGAIYGGLRALVQTNIRTRLAYAALSFWSILWWYLASTGTESAPAILYFCALALIMQGLFISAYLLEKRHGDLNIDQVGGLARLMPRFGILLSLLVAAATGLPLFGSFSALIAMATSPALTLSWSFGVVLLAWLLSSWHFPVFMQGILLGPPKAARIYSDLHPGETLSLVLIVIMIVILGIAPNALP